MKTIAFLPTTPLYTLKPRVKLVSYHSRPPACRSTSIRHARIVCNLDAGDQGGDMTCGDAFREWIVARDKGEGAQDPSDSRSCAGSRLDILFVGTDNNTVSAAAEAIFTDLCTRRALDCFSCHSVGTRVEREGEPPDWSFVEALRMKRGLDIGRKMSCALDKGDLESYGLVVCMDDAIRSELLYMLVDDEGKYNDAEEDRFVLLSSYCANPKLKSLQFKSGKCGRTEMNFMLSALVDACNGLLVSLIESPPVPPA